MRNEKDPPLPGLIPHSCHLLTLTGAGGTGKTRLALQVAADLLEEKEDGVWLVELAPLADPALVPQAVATALGVREPGGPENGGKPLIDVLMEWLRPKRLLLLLDNCEHLLLACAELADRIVRGCPGVQILATSREGLNIPGETTYRLPSLAAPDPHQPPPTLETLTQYEAVRLFIDRAVAALPSFAVTNENAPAVAQVCHRLDGIPLAIELAAVRVKVLPIEKISERLDDRFRLLTGGSRTALPRQQTLRALIDWSYDLLPEPERVLLRRLSVFAGGWTLEAAESVCAGAGLEEWDILGLLAHLVEKSLALFGGEPRMARYHLLETVRQYSRDRLVEAGELELVRGQHARCFLRLAEEADPELHGAQQAQWFERLEQEHDNLRAALAWGLGQSSVASRQSLEGLSTDDQRLTTGLRLAGALWWFWYLRGYFSEGKAWLEQALALPAAVPRTAMRAKALQGLGGLALFRSDFTEARPLLEESVAIWRELENPRSLAYTLRGLGWVAMGLNDYALARSLVEENLAIYRRLGDRQAIARSLDLVAHAATASGDHSRALSLWEESLALARETGDQYLIGWVLYVLGRTAEHEGNAEGASAFYRESLAIRRELGHKPGIAMCVEALARLAHAQKQPERAARLFGATAALHQALGAARLPDWLPGSQTDPERDRAAVKAELGEERFAAAFAAGKSLTQEQMIAEALEHAAP